MPVTVYGESALHVLSSVRPAPGVALGSVEVAVGGPAAVVALQLARLGHPPRFVGVCGDDPAGALIRAELCRCGVDCAGLVAGGRTARVVAVVNGVHAELAADPGTSWSAYPHRDDPPPPTPGPAYVTGFPELVPAIRALGRHGRKLVVDVGYIPLLSRPDDLLQHVSSIVDAIDVCVISGAQLSPGLRDELAGCCLAGGVRVVLTTLAADGVLVTTGRASSHLPAYPVDAVDPLCAGDAFVAGFLCATEEGHDPVVAAGFGQAVAAAKVCMLGRLPDREQVDRLVAAGRPR